MNQKPIPSFGATIRIEYPNVVGMLGKITSALGQAGGDIGSIDIVSVKGNRIVREISLSASNVDQIHDIIKEIKKVPGVTIKHVTDRTFAMHHGGKIEINGKHPAQNNQDLAMVYTPGVARVALDIYEHPTHVYSYTIKSNTIAIVTDGTAVLGLGDIGPQAALPVMEGKAMLFKQFAGVNAFPICLDTREPEEIIKIVKGIAPGFGGINLEDIAAPRCFEIEEHLAEILDIPVFHDDQHGTAIVVLAALTNALKLVKKELSSIKLVVCGAGAAGIACTKLLIAAGADPGRIILCNSSGIINRKLEGLNRYQRELAEITNARGLAGSVHDAVVGADVFLGVSRPGVITREDVDKMAEDPVVFALANPVPEILPEEAGSHVRIMATGRSDYPNQINNVLCFPGFFRGLLDSRAKAVTTKMKLAAARAIAGLVKPGELNEDYIIPSAFDRRIPAAVAEAVAKAAAAN